MNPDVAVIGAGAFGAWTAWHLRRAGASVLLVDAWGPGHSRASSGGESRVIRMGYGPDEIYTRMAMRSLTLWREMFDRRRAKLFHRTGVLWMAREADPYTVATRETLTRCGVALEWLDSAEMAHRFPQTRFGAAGLCGILEPASGALMARRAVAEVVRDGVESGVVYETRAMRAAGEIHSGAMVFACGPWLAKLFPDLLGKRIRVTRQEVFFFAPPEGNRSFQPGALPIWIDFGDSRGPYGFPDLESRGVKLAFDRHGGEFDPDCGDRAITPEGLREARGFLADRFPALADAPLTESRVCQYENSSNGDFLVDRHPEHNRVWLAGGGSGHGFKHGPAVGEYLAARILGGGREEPRFSLASKSEAHRRTVY